MRELRNGDLWYESDNSWLLVVQNNSSHEFRIVVLWKSAFLFNLKEEERLEKTYLNKILGGKCKYLGNIQKIRKKVNEELKHSDE